MSISRRQLLGAGAVSAATVGAGLSRAAFAAGQATTPANVRVSHDRLTGHAETFLAANPRNPRNLLGACIANTPSNSAIAAYASFDGGVSWHNAGALRGSEGGRDPSVAFDAHGRGYICANTDNVHVWRTDDAGRSFAAPVLATHGQKLDHPWLAAAPGAPEAGLLYGAWTTGHNNTQLGFIRSIDAGRTFEPQTVIATVSGPREANFASPMAAAGPRGAVYVAYGVWPPLPSGSQRPEIVAPIRVSRSSDHGRTWADPVELGRGVMEIRVTPDATSPGLPAIAADRRRHLAALAFITRRPAHASFTDIVVTVSTDGGRNWTAPVPVPRRSDDIVHFQPQLAIGDNGALALTAFAYQRGRVDVMLFTAPPGTTRFSQPRRVTSRPFNPALAKLGGGKHGAWWIGDYQGLTWAGDKIHPFWNDTRTGHLEVFTATV